MDKLTARYARTLFLIASQKDEVCEYSEQIAEVYEFIKNDGDFKTIIYQPNIVLDDKIEYIEKTFFGRIHEEILGFFYAILRNNYENDISNIFEYFLDLVSVHGYKMRKAI